MHTWSVRLTDAEMAKALREVRLGDLQDVKVTATGETGRVATADVVGEEGTVHGVRPRAAPAARAAQPLVRDPPRAGAARPAEPNGFEPDWTDPRSSGTLAGRMYALHAIATQQNAAPAERSVVVRALSGTGMTFDLPRGS